VEGPALSVPGLRDLDGVDLAVAIDVGAAALRAVDRAVELATISHRTVLHQRQRALEIEIRRPDGHGDSRWFSAGATAGCG